MPDSVIVIGGGVGGLTAAHELAERGFAVTVYEARPDWGGKARSQPVSGSGTGGRHDLPGEHGFRFYPRFYCHVIDVMKRIPVPGGSVVDRLRPTTESAIALVDRDTWYRFHRRRMDRPLDVVEAMELFFQELDFDTPDMALFTAKIIQFFTSCDARRLGEYEQQSWWDFLQGDDYSPRFQRQLRAVPRTMVAMDPRRGSARTIGTISMQLILDYADTGVNNDRTMGGPTSEMWIDPWIAHLGGLGVNLVTGAKVDKIEVSGGKISGVRLVGAAAPVTADHYVLAVPLDVAIGMITPAMGALDPALEALRTTNADDLVSWMVGIQFFLYEDVPMVRGHTFYPDSRWALTSISQPQFWRDLGLFRRRYGDGAVGGILSVDISDWDTPGAFVGKPARLCTANEIAEEIWQQLKAAVNGAEVDQQVLTDDLRHSWHIDDDLDFSGGAPVNRSRLLVHPPGSWALRPEARSRIPNLTLAADYVRTHTNLASMEGACEAGRRATNAILDRSAWAGQRCRIWPLVEPSRFEMWKRYDARRYAAGKPHFFERLGLRRATSAIHLFRRLRAATGFDHVDDALDGVRVSRIVKDLAGRLGIS